MTRRLSVGQEVSHDRSPPFPLDRSNGFAAASACAGISSLNSPAPQQTSDSSLFDKNEEAYWAEMRKQFLIPEDEIYLNNGTVGSSPAPVLRAIFDGYTTTEKMDRQDPEDYPIWGYAAWERVSRSPGRVRRLPSR